jgi:serine/tyrosine/threonine adenylyltransferase
MVELTSDFADALPELGVAWKAEQAPDPRLVLVNRDLGVDGVTAEDLLGDGFAMAYAGHQFGGFSPRLGDGRALLLGELPDGRDLHLKGSGRTPFARGGDGKAPLGPMLREYVISEAMHALGIPTTRSLAVLTTGEKVVREQGYEPGAVLARVAASHLRVGTFQYAARDEGVLRRLTDYAIARHYPDAATPLEFYERVIDRQAALVARWMQVGFVHGVMNTDNTTISGETIDYGPCAFLDVWDPATVFSSIDHGGRYAFGNQPAVLQWNLARLGETLLPLLDDDLDRAVEQATEAVRGFTARYEHHLRAGWQAKLGLAAPPQGLLDDLVPLLKGRDHTVLLRDLAEHLRGGPVPMVVSAGSDSVPLDDPWVARWKAEDPDPAAMDRVNPVYIPRNHLVDEALTAAVAGDLEPFQWLLDVLAHPFEARPGFERYATGGDGRAFVTFCGT